MRGESVPAHEYQADEPVCSRGFRHEAQDLMVVRGFQLGVGLLDDVEFTRQAAGGDAILHYVLVQGI